MTATLRPATRVPRILAGWGGLALAVGLAIAACTSGSGGTLSDEEWIWCQGADAGELDAAAEALNIDPDADRALEGGRSRDDPAFARMCKYAYEARGRDLTAPDANPPAEVSPSAPLQPNPSPGG